MTTSLFNWATYLPDDTNELETVLVVEASVPSWHTLEYFLKQSHCLLPEPTYLSLISVGAAKKWHFLVVRFKSI